MITNAKFLLAALLVASLPLTAMAQAEQPTKQKNKKELKEHAGMHTKVPKEAVAVLAPTKGSKVQGIVLLKQMNKSVKIVGKVVGLTPGMHGFHIHEYGDLRDPAGKSAGGHFNPAGVPHAGPKDKQHHVGDLGNIEANEQGEASFEMDVKDMKLHFVVGRSFVVHGGQDDLESQPSGAAGPRVAVGVIGFAQVKEKTE